MLSMGTNSKIVTFHLIRLIYIEIQQPKQKKQLSCILTSTKIIWLLIKDLIKLYLLTFIKKADKPYPSTKWVTWRHLILHSSINYILSNLIKPFWYKTNLNNFISLYYRLLFRTFCIFLLEFTFIKLE